MSALCCCFDSYAGLCDDCIPSRVVNDQNGNVVNLSFGIPDFSEQSDDRNTFLELIFPELRLLENRTLSIQRKGLGVAAAVHLNCMSAERKLSRLTVGNVPEVRLDKTYLPALTSLTLKQTQVSGLELLQLPGLMNLTLNQVSFKKKIKFTKHCEKISPAGLNQFSSAPVRLSDNLPKLTGVSIRAVSSADFDFTSLSSHKLQTLLIENYDGKSLDFLRGLPLHTLSLSASDVTDKSMEILGTLPLENLFLDVSSISDYRFLSHLKLKKLHLMISKRGNFSLELLKDMPLEELHLYNAGDCGSWGVLGKDSLTELVLVNIYMDDPAFLSELKLENLALLQCYLGKVNLMENIAVMTTLRQLYIGSVFYFDGKKETLLNKTLAWDKLNIPLTALSFWGNNLSFCKNIPSLEFLSIFVLDRNADLGLNSLQNRFFKILVLGNVENARSAVKNSGIRAAHVYFSEAPDFLAFSLE
ncbi:MAG: hypothetical protein HPZ91_06775 [Lentisphaeria bacterium]|nr:hypothetical protein [Lentisphaeria bacterium]